MVLLRRLLCSLCGCSNSKWTYNFEEMESLLSLLSVQRQDLTVSRLSSNLWASCLNLKWWVLFHAYPEFLLFNVVRTFRKTPKRQAMYVHHLLCIPCFVEHFYWFIFSLFNSSPWWHMKILLFCIFKLLTQRAQKPAIIHKERGIA